MKRAVVLLAVALVAGSGYGAADYWVDGNTGSWTNGANWQDGTAPGSGDTGELNGSGTANIDSAITVGGIIVESTANPTVNISANVTVGDIFVGRDDDGTINQTAGAVNVIDELLISRHHDGIYNLSGGSMVHSSGSRGTLVGLQEGTGTFNLSGNATFEKTGTGEDVEVGIISGATGLIDLSGSSSFTQNSGAGGEVQLGKNSGASGIIRISDTATFDAKEAVRVGQVGYGEIDMDGGTFIQNTAGWGMAVGDSAGSKGVINVAGTAQFTSTKTLIVGGYGDGGLNVRGGTVTSSGNMYVGNKNGGTGAVNLSSGSLDKSGGGDINVGQDAGSVGELNVSGGTLTVANNKAINVGRNGVGTLTQTDGDIDAGYLILGNGDGSGDYTISGGSLDLVEYLNLVGDGSTFTVSGTGADHIEVDRLRLSGETMTIELDDTILGSTLITADDAVNVSDLNGTFNLDTLIDFSGVANGTTYNIAWTAANFVNESLMTFNDLSTTAEFEWSILSGVDQNGNAGTGEMLQVTVIPEPATLGMVAFLGGAMVWIRRKFLI